MDQENVAQLPQFAQTGWLIKFNEMTFLDQHHPGRSYKVRGNIFLMSRPPPPQLLRNLIFSQGN